ncbi:hypothetical protein [Candidatus Chromulinivorax destructor]|uniref:Uncharacterized protein n=1 Tax=Candidatus Chromulinivorax destructor TaxID=2066483 RepID=A0A345ZCX0_9BACT|nr:hypothetical protein [Candidatus Chromulinivorax destructor]AXK61137.1 hypothetical protein C0J27_05400 [Candidatus Chromulinivorax destructor]
MQKIYTLMLAISLIGLQASVVFAKNVKPTPDNTCIVVNKTVIQPLVPKQQVFIAENGNLGIYQANTGKAYIDENAYKKVSRVLITDSGKISKKPFRKAYLGMLVEDDKKYALFGRESDPEPINDAPDADVRTEEKIQEDFGSNFGSGRYTPNDKWD